MIYIQPRDTQLGSEYPCCQNAEYQAFKVSPVFFLLTPSSNEAGTLSIVLPGAVFVSRAWLCR